MGCSRKWPYCKEHSKPLHKCVQCVNQYFAGILISAEVRQRLVWKCKHGTYLDKCHECKHKIYQQVYSLPQDQLDKICEPSKTKPLQPFQAPVPWAADQLLPLAPALPAPTPPVQLATCFKRPRLARGTLFRRTLPEEFTMAGVEEKRKELAARFQQEQSTAYSFEVYKLNKPDHPPQLYKLYVEVDYQHTVWDDAQLKLNLDGVDAYLLALPEQRRAAVLALRKTVSQGSYQAKVLTSEQKSQLHEKIQKQPFLKSIVDLISRWWLLVKFAIPHIKKWKHIIKTCVATGVVAAERQAFFLKVQHMQIVNPAAPIQLDLPALDLSGTYTEFNPITPEVQRYPAPVPAFDDSLSFLDIAEGGDSDLDQHLDDLVRDAAWCAFLPTFEACGLQRPEQVRIPGGRVTVTSQTAMTVESPLLAELKVGMFFWRLTKTFKITAIESKTITFEKIKDGNCMEPLYVGKLSANYPNLNSGSILFRVLPQADDGNTLAIFSHLKLQPGANQVTKFITI